MADEQDNEVLTRDYGIRTFTLPTGRVVGVEINKGTGTYKITFSDGKPGSLPQEFAGIYTGRTRAESDARRYVTQFWDLSDSSSRKNKTQSAERR